MNQNQPATPACPVSRCGAKTPHTTNVTVHAFMRQSPAEVIDWTKRCIVELIQSVIDDANKGHIFAYLTRWRDLEELYRRVLYAMFVAPADHLPHIFSGEMLNLTILEYERTLTSCDTRGNTKRRTTRRFFPWPLALSAREAVTAAASGR